MATVKKIKKAQNGVFGWLKGCKWDKGEKSYRMPLREKISNIRGGMQAAKEQRQAAREERRNPSKGDVKGIERDFPEGGAAPGLWNETKGSKTTRWNSDGTSMKKGGKVSKSVKKAQDGDKVKGPTYKNLRMGVNAKNSQGSGRFKEVKPSKEDSAAYRFGYGRGLRGEKEYPGEPSVQKMGRWEGQNATKSPKKKMKSGGSFPDLNKDGKITKADILKGRGVIAKKGASVKKAKMGCMSCGGKMKKK